MSVVGLVAAIAVPLWVLRRGEQSKKSLPSRNEVALFALRALVAEQNLTKKNRPADSEAGLAYDDLFERIIDDCNFNTRDGNFRVGDKNKKLHDYTRDSIESLSSPPCGSEPLIAEGANASVYRVTQQGRSVYERVQSGESAERAMQLNEHLTGSVDLFAGQLSSPAAQTAATRAIERPSSAKEWRYAVFMEVPDGAALKRAALVSNIAECLSPKGSGRSAHTKVDKALQWNLNNGNLESEADGHIRLVADKANKSLDDFK